MQVMVIPLPNFITKFVVVLTITLWDRGIFCRYCVMSCAFRVTKFYKPCLVSTKKYPLSQVSMKCQQTLIKHQQTLNKLTDFSSSISKKTQ